MRVDEVLPLREQALYPASGGVPFCRVWRFVHAMNKVGLRMAVVTSSPTRLLEAKSAGKEEFLAMFEGVVCGDDVQCGKPDLGILPKAAAVLGVPSCPKAKI
jgi:beta-phosphoglucomutase-like phosphatase (HAD superfamily)